METEVLAGDQLFDTEKLRLSNTDRTESPAFRFSRKLWNFSWNDYLPLSLPHSDERVEPSDFETASKFYQNHSSQIFEETEWASPFLAGQRDEPAQAKIRYYQEMGDFFIFKKNDEMVGVLVGTPIDWSSYYIRSAFLIPQFQGGKRYQLLVSHIMQVLQKHGVQRVEVDTSPSNLSIIHIHNKFKFNVTGMLLSERWGSLLHFTKFLNTQKESIFLNQFCYGTRPQTK